VLAGHVVVEARGLRRVRSVSVDRIDAGEHLAGAGMRLACDLVAVSGGFSPVIHLHCQAGGKAVWDDTLAAFLPGTPAQSERAAGACAGARTLRDCAVQGHSAGAGAAAAAGFGARPSPAPVVPGIEPGGLRALWLVPHPRGTSRAPKQFVDLQNDVTAADIQLAVREGFESIEHLTDGSVAPGDLGMEGLVATGKDCLGRRSLSRSDTARADRRQLVGLLADDPLTVLPEGAQVLVGKSGVARLPMAGHVTSSYASPTLQRSIALALVSGGRSRVGEGVHVATRDGRMLAATIASPVFYDPQGQRQHA